MVRATFLERGRTEDSNLQYAERWFDDARLRNVGSPVPKMLRLYRRLLSRGATLANGADPVQLGLRLIGLAAERQQPDGPRRLEVRSRIFGETFDINWAREKEASRAIAEPLARWIENQQKEEFLIGGDALRDSQSWAEGRDDLNADERAFLQACERAEQERGRAVERRTATRQLVAVLAGMITLLTSALGIALFQYREAREAQKKAEVNGAIANVQRLAALAEFASASNVPQRGPLLAVEAVQGARAAGSSLVTAEQAIGNVASAC